MIKKPLHWTGFYMIWTSVIKELIVVKPLTVEGGWRTNDDEV